MALRDTLKTKVQGHIQASLRQIYEYKNLSGRTKEGSVAMVCYNALDIPRGNSDLAYLPAYQ